jgi:signal transduction histidine kinase
VRIRQAIENVLSNALTHTPRSGHVRVSAGLDGGSVRLTVQDTGPGFDPGVLPRAFEPFTIGPAPQRGTGLGLAIVQAIAEAHGGHATAENMPAGGARVTICLPVTG